MRTTAHRYHKGFLRIILAGLVICMNLAGVVQPAFADSGAKTGDLSILPAENLTLPGNSNLPSLSVFAASIAKGGAKTLAGVYVPGVLAYSVLQQPTSQPGFVSHQAGSVTLFRMALDYGTIALLAHNDSSGSQFFKLKRLQDVYLVYGNGSLKHFLITKVDSFQALQPDSPYSSFVDLSQPGKVLSVEDLFYRVYAGGFPLVFQTCIEKDGLLSWGRLFVTAIPAPGVGMRFSSIRMR